MTAAEQQAAQLAQFEAGARLAESELTLCLAQLEAFKKFEHVERQLWRAMMERGVLATHKNDGGEWAPIDELAEKFLEAQKANSQATLHLLELGVKKMESQKEVLAGLIDQIKNAPLVEVPGRKLHVPGA
jgi:hypothetical protein